MNKKEKISYIFPEDLGGLEQDENGNYVVPEGFEIYRIVDKTQERINQLEEEISNMTEPTDAELIELGKMFDDYHIKKEELQRLKDRIK